MKITFNIKTFLCLSVLLYFTNQMAAQVVVIDPGHGYSSTGGNPDGRTDTEIATALSVGLKLRDQLQNSCNGWTVRMTRSTRNGWVSLTQRRTMSNNWEADRFISIHCNAGGGTGTETFWCNRSNSPDASNSRFSRQVQDRMVEKGQWRDRRSVEDASFIFHLGVLTNNNAIGVLNEVGFVDSGDASKLLNNTWRNRFADAYFDALQNDLGRTCSPPLPPTPTDRTPPTTSISIVGGNTQSGNFTATFNDKDNIAVTRRFYQVLENYNDLWYANRTKGFFNDSFDTFYSVYEKGAGSWAINSGRMRQSNAASTNTNLSSYLAQNTELPYLYEFDAKVISTSGPRKFGIHIMSDNSAANQRGNSYLVWFHGEKNQLELYETVNNVLNTRAITTISHDNNLNNYKITYSPAFGVIEIFKNNKSILRWVDSSPIKKGSFISLRTNQTQAEFDNLKVYKYRPTNTKLITAGSVSTNDLRRKNGRIGSLVRDAVGNWSSTGSLDVVISTLTRQAENIIDDAQLLGGKIVLYPNPTDGTVLNLSYPQDVTSDLNIYITDIRGKIVREKRINLTNKTSGDIDISDLIEPVAKGVYFVKIQSQSYSKVMRIIRN